MDDYLSSVVLNVLDEFNVSFPEGAAARAAAIALFEATLRNGRRRGSYCGVKASRAESLAFWDWCRRQNPTVTACTIRALQRKVAALRKKRKRSLDRLNGVGTMGDLLSEHRWRTLSLGDHEEKVWREKLSFVPVVSIGSFSSQNVRKLQEVQERLVKAVRLRGGAHKTKTHQSGRSVGRTVVSGGRVPSDVRERNASVNHVSGTVQLAKFTNERLQKDVTAMLTACIEEAFGDRGWYKAAKLCFEKVPLDWRLPGSSLPASSIWWNWNSRKSRVHIDTNAVLPCFVLCPYSREGAELLCAAGERKIPMSVGRVVGGCWHRFPHCNDVLRGKDKRYSFVVYFDSRMLNRSYLAK